jgi:transposase
MTFPESTRTLLPPSRGRGNGGKLAVIVWHVLTKEEPHAYHRPLLTAIKQCSLEIQAGLPTRRGRKGAAAAYSVKALRDRERATLEPEERAYMQRVARCRPQSTPMAATLVRTRAKGASHRQP